MLSYAGINLTQPTKEAKDFIERHISYDDVPVVTYRSWPGKNLTGITLPTGFYPMKHIKVNKLYWYTGASRWGYGYFFCSADELTKIQNIVMGPKCTQYTSQNLNISDGMGPDTTNSISPKMFLAATLPLSGIRGVNGFYLLYLVDVRYFWWAVPTPDIGIVPTTNWGDLYSSCQAAINQAISYDPISDNYMQPSPDLELPYEAMPPYLDAIAYNVGQRITLGLDGKVRALNYTSSQTNLALNLNQDGLANRKRAGDSRFSPTII